MEIANAEKLNGEVFGGMLKKPNPKTPSWLGLIVMRNG